MGRRILSILLSVFTFLTMTYIKPITTNAYTETTPASFQNVTYQFRDNVKFKNLSGITSTGDNIMIPGENFKPGDIVVDKPNQKSLKILKVNPDNSLVTVKPSVGEIFSQFNIPRQTIKLTESNLIEYEIKSITPNDYLIKKIADMNTQSGSSQQVMSGTLPPKLQEIVSKADRIYTFENQEYTLYEQNGAKVKVMMNGSVGVGLDFTADYDLFGGYEFSAGGAQFIDVQVKFDAQINKELYYPLYGFNVDVAGVGSVKAGLMLVVAINGEITLVVKVQEGISVSAGVKGDTSFGIPTSFDTFGDFDDYYGAEADPMGDISAGCYIAPVIGLEFFDINVFGAQLRLGLEANAKKVSGDALEYGIYFAVHIFVDLLGDRYNLVHESVPIIERKKTIRGGFAFYTSGLCAYQDRLTGAVFTAQTSGGDSNALDPFSDKEPYVNKDLEVWYYKKGNDPNGGANLNPDYKIPVKTDYRGVYSLYFKDLSEYGFQNVINVSEGDRIIIKVPGVDGAETRIISSSNPFGNYFNINDADFFENKLIGRTKPGLDLTRIDVPGKGYEDLENKKLIYYTGPVKITSMDADGGNSEVAWINTNAYGLIDGYPRKTESALLNSAALGLNTYDIKPDREIKGVINIDGFIINADKIKTVHHVKFNKVRVDNQVIIEDLEGNTVGIQHNIENHILAVNTNGKKSVDLNANLVTSIGKVPADYIPKVSDFIPDETPFFVYPVGNIRHPDHFEYHTDKPFPVELYSKQQTVALNEANNLDYVKISDAGITGKTTSAHIYWKWEERYSGYPVELPTRSVTGSGLSIRKIRYNNTTGANLSKFEGLPAAYVYNAPKDPQLVYDGTETIADVLSTKTTCDFYAEGYNFIADEAPPAPRIKKDQGLLTDFQKGTLKMEDYRQFVTNPFKEMNWGEASFGGMSGTTKVMSGSVILNYNEVPDWSRNYVMNAVSSGILDLDSNGNFPAGRNTTRAEFSNAIVKALGLDSSNAVRSGFPFKDVAASGKYYKTMEIAYQCGIINGTSDTTFSPDESITRQDAATMLMRAFRLENAGLIPQTSSNVLERFSDKGDISSYAIVNMEQAVALKFFSGTDLGTLMPLDNILNEQTAKIMWEMKLKAK